MNLNIGHRKYVVKMTDMYTVKKYIEELLKQNEKNRYIVFTAEIAKWAGLEPDSPIISARPMRNLCRATEKLPGEVMRMVTQKGLVKWAVADLIEFSTECGIKAYDARKKDKREEGAIFFLHELFMVADKQELYLVSTHEYNTDKTSVPDTDTLPELSNPLAVMADEMGYGPRVWDWED